MWKGKKKFILISLAAALVLVGSLAGAAYAQTGSDNGTSSNPLLAKVASILGIEQEKVEAAFAQAQEELKQEALQSFLDKLVGEGKLTQEQADQYKAWLDARPEISIFDGKGRMGVPGFYGPKMSRGMPGRGWMFQCPAPSTTPGATPSLTPTST